MNKKKSKSDKRKLTKALPPQKDAWRTVTDCGYPTSGPANSSANRIANRTALRSRVLSRVSTSNWSYEQEKEQE
jgi:hypothetical protein